MSAYPILPASAPALVLPVLPSVVGPARVSAVLTFYVGADNTTGARVSPVTVVRVLACHGIDGATIREARGIWNGGAEDSTVVDVVLPALGVAIDAVAVAAGVAEALRAAHNQRSVLWTLTPVLAGEALRT